MDGARDREMEEQERGRERSRKQNNKKSIVVENPRATIINIINYERNDVKWKNTIPMQCNWKKKRAGEKKVIFEWNKRTVEHFRQNNQISFLINKQYLAEALVYLLSVSYELRSKWAGMYKLLRRFTHSCSKLQ